MDNEKLNNEEELAAEVTEEVVSDTTEAAVLEMADETAEAVEAEADTEAEEASEADYANEATGEVVSDTTENTVLEMADYATEGTVETAKKSANKLVVGIAAAVAAAAVIVALLMAFDIVPKPFKKDANEKALKIRVVKNNPYEKDYIDTTGQMIGEIADKNGYTMEEYRELFGLPKDMPASTNSNAAQNYIPLKIMMKQYEMTIDQLREAYGFGEDITEETTLGEATGELTLAALFGLSDASDEEKAENLAKIKEMYGLGDDVTLETKYKDVRQQIDEYMKASREAAE